MSRFGAEHVDLAASLDTFSNGGYEQHDADDIRVWKTLDDLDRYERIIAKTQPDVIVETGTRWGGSAIWFEQTGRDVITVDIEPSASQRARQVATRVTWVVGSSIDPVTVAHVAQLVAGRRVMVSLDAEHAAPHVVEEIRAYGPLVSPGCYLVVEDGIFDLAEDRAMKRRGGASIPTDGGPLVAIERELLGAPGWTRDEAIEALHPISHHPAGFWVRNVD